MRKKAFRCRNIYTAVTDELIDGYVVTDGNKIIFVGSQEDSKEYIDSNTEVFDVSNNFIMPGFNDFHVHLVSAWNTQIYQIRRRGRKISVGFA